MLYTSYVQKAFLKPQYQKQGVLSALLLLTASATIGGDEEVGPKGQRIAQPLLHKALLFFFLLCFFVFSLPRFKTRCYLHLLARKKSSSEVKIGTA